MVGSHNVPAHGVELSSLWLRTINSTFITLKVLFEKIACPTENLIEPQNGSLPY